MNNQMVIKKKMPKLDLKDKKLLRELDINSRTPLSEIAKRIGTSKEVANYRFVNMIDSGLIKRFSPLINNFALGQTCYRIVLNIHNLKYHMRRKVVDELRKMSNVDVNVYLSSDWDIEMNFWVRKSSEFFDFYSNLMKKYSKYIKDKEIFVILRTHHLGHKYLHDGRTNYVFEDVKVNEKIDKDEDKILDILDSEPKIDIVSVSEKMRMPVSTTHSKIKSLIKKGLFLGCVPVIDKGSMGYNTFKVQIVLEDPQDKNEFIQYLKSSPNVTKITEFVGPIDLEFEIDFKTTKELDNFLENMRLDVPKMRDFEVINISDD